MKLLDALVFYPASDFNEVCFVVRKTEKTNSLKYIIL